MSVVCDYCKARAHLVTGKVIYPHRADLAHKNFYSCTPCKAYVGCHPNTIVPLGRLADLELRRAKSSAHAAFDPLWKSKDMTRSEAYEWLAGKLKIHRNDCHIGMFDVRQCRDVVEICGALP